MFAIKILIVLYLNLNVFGDDDPYWRDMIICFRHDWKVLVISKMGPNTWCLPNRIAREDYNETAQMTAKLLRDQAGVEAELASQEGVETVNTSNGMIYTIFVYTCTAIEELPHWLSNDFPRQLVPVDPERRKWLTVNEALPLLRIYSQMSYRCLNRVARKLSNAYKNGSCLTELRTPMDILKDENKGEEIVRKTLEEKTK